jgi:hypothetical protein
MFSRRGATVAKARAELLERAADRAYTAGVGPDGLP